MDLEEIVMKLIGPIHPIGIRADDYHRLENMKILVALVFRLLLRIQTESYKANSDGDSVKTIGIYAKNFLNNVRSGDL